MIYLGADHRGFKLKEKLRGWLVDNDINYKDLGAEKFDKADNYTVYAERVASVVADTKGEMGVLLCGSGVGVDVVANKFDGIRASIGKTPAQVKAGRKDDDMNILVIAADFTSLNDSLKMLKMFLNTKFSGKARHKKRLSEINKIEANN